MPSSVLWNGWRNGKQTLRIHLLNKARLSQARVARTISQRFALQRFLAAKKDQPEDWSKGAWQLKTVLSDRANIFPGIRNLSSLSRPT